MPYSSAVRLVRIQFEHAISCSHDGRIDDAEKALGHARRRLDRVRVTLAQDELLALVELETRAAEAVRAGRDLPRG